MEQQNNPQNNQQNQNPRQNVQNRPPMDRSRSKPQDRKPQEKGFSQDKGKMDRNQPGNVQQAHNDRSRGHNDPSFNQKAREQRGPEKKADENQQKSPLGQPGNQTHAAVATGAPVASVATGATVATGQALNTNNNNQNRFRNPVKNPPHADPAARQIKPKRIETVEDIQADIERIDKDIQFEIKQIRAVKLGL